MYLGSKEHGKFFGLKFKFISLISIFFIIFGVIMSWFFLSKTKIFLENELREDGLSTAKNLAHNSVYGISIGDSETLTKLIEGLKGERNVAYVIILDTDGKVLAHTDSKERGKIYTDDISVNVLGADDPVINEYAPKKTNGEYFYIDVAVPVKFNKKIGVVRVGMTTRDINKKLKKDLTIITFITIGIIIVGIFVSIFFVRMIVTPIEKMVLIASEIANGNFTHSVEVNSKDEVGILASAFSKMIVTLNQMIKKIREVSNNVADASENIFITSNKVKEGAQIQATSTDQTASSIGQMSASIKEIATSVEVLSSSAEETSSSVLEMSASINEVNNNASTLSSAVEDTSSSIIQVSSSIKQIAENVEILWKAAENMASSISQVNGSVKEVERNAKESTQLSKKATSDARELGMKSIEKTIDGMKRIKETVEITSEVVNRLGERSKHIGKILTVIDEVTKQTNLLALNAAILAAQAGEQGKGFAVVADEIKNLADRTDTSTKEIAQLITDVQSETKDAVETIKKGAVSVEDGVKLSLEAGDALKKIVESSEKSTAMTMSIENATIEQSKGISQVTESMDRISTMVQQIARGTNEQMKAAEQITESSEKMKDISKHVKTSTVEQVRAGKQISDAIENVTDRVTHIVNAIGEQKKGSDIITRSIKEIADITQESAKISSEMNVTVESLTKQAELLKEEMDRFKV
ncbi:MAG: methyl-accepting chemotaxis protein [Nitrospirota bacterium]